MPIQATATIEASLVQDLEFFRIEDFIRPDKWVLWEVRFSIDGVAMTGYLGGCPAHPKLFHEDFIEDCEVL